MGDVPRSLYTTPNVWEVMIASAMPDKTTGRRLRAISWSKLDSETLVSDFVSDICEQVRKTDVEGDYSAFVVKRTSFKPRDG
jgi:hypothetical protein